MTAAFLPQSIFLHNNYYSAKWKSSCSQHKFNSLNYEHDFNNKNDINKDAHLILEAVWLSENNQI